MTVVAIHQPNFFPWLGYFNKIVEADLFVFLDHVQFPKTGGSWSNRVKLRFGSTAQWITAPIGRAFHGRAAINEIAFREDQPWRKKLLKTIRTNYGRAPYFRECESFLSGLIGYQEANLARYNAHVVQSIVRYMELKDTTFLFSSQLKVAGSGTAMLVDILRKVDGTTYLSGDGAGDYQQDLLFAENGIKLVKQGFVHPQYSHIGSGEFIPGLSIIDAFMNCGKVETVNMVGLAK